MLYISYIDWPIVDNTTTAISNNNNNDDYCHYHSIDDNHDLDNN